MSDDLCGNPNPDDPSMTCVKQRTRCRNQHICVVNGEELGRWPNAFTTNVLAVERRKRINSEGVMAGMKEKVKPETRAGTAVAEHPDPVDVTRARYEEFCDLNPWVYDALERFMAVRVAAGEQRISIAALFEDFRSYQAGQTTDPNAVYRISNDYKPHYARALLAANPDWSDLMEIKKLKNE